MHPALLITGLKSLLGAKSIAFDFFGREDDAWEERATKRETAPPLAFSLSSTTIQDT
jgi:hypothetical protein